MDYGVIDGYNYEYINDNDNGCNSINEQCSNPLLGVPQAPVIESDIQINYQYGREEEKILDDEEQEKEKEEEHKEENSNAERTAYVCEVIAPMINFSSGEQSQHIINLSSEQYEGVKELNNNEDIIVCEAINEMNNNAADYYNNRKELNSSVEVIHNEGKEKEADSEVPLCLAITDESVGIVQNQNDNNNNNNNNDNKIKISSECNNSDDQDDISEEDDGPMAEEGFESNSVECYDELILFDDSFLCKKITLSYKHRCVISFVAVITILIATFDLVSKCTGLKYRLKHVGTANSIVQALYMFYTFWWIYTVRLLYRSTKSNSLYYTLKDTPVKLDSLSVEKGDGQLKNQKKVNGRDRINIKKAGMIHVILWVGLSCFILFGLDIVLMTMNIIAKRDQVVNSISKDLSRDFELAGGDYCFSPFLFFSIVYFYFSCDSFVIHKRLNRVFVFNTKTKDKSFCVFNIFYISFFFVIALMSVVITALTLQIDLRNNYGLSMSDSSYVDTFEDTVIVGYIAIIIDGVWALYSSSNRIYMLGENTSDTNGSRLLSFWKLEKYYSIIHIPWIIGLLSTVLTTGYTPMKNGDFNSTATTSGIFMSQVALVFVICCIIETNYMLQNTIMEYISLFLKWAVSMSIGGLLFTVVEVVFNLELFTNSLSFGTIISSFLLTILNTVIAILLLCYSLKRSKDSSLAKNKLSKPYYMIILPSIAMLISSIIKLFISGVSKIFNYKNDVNSRVIADFRILIIFDGVLSLINLVTYILAAFFLLRIKKTKRVIIKKSKRELNNRPVLVLPGNCEEFIPKDDDKNYNDNAFYNVNWNGKSLDEIAKQKKQKQKEELSKMSKIDRIRAKNTDNMKQKTGNLFYGKRY